MSFNFSVVLILPLDLRESGNRGACALGHDVMPGGTYSVPLSADGGAPATHYGCHTWAQQQFIDLLAASSQGQLPPVDWAGCGLSVADMQAVSASVIASVRIGGDPSEHWADVLTAHALQIAA